MCLMPDFFENRDQILRKSEAKGEKELSRFMEEKEFEFQWLFKMGLLEPKEICSTAELESFEVSTLGKRYLREDKQWQIIFVRHNRQMQFVNAINTMRRSSA
jgi:hypothetical protein